MFWTLHFGEGFGDRGAIVSVVGETEMGVFGKAVGVGDFDDGVDEDGPPGFESGKGEEGGVAEGGVDMFEGWLVYTWGDNAGS